VLKSYSRDNFDFVDQKLESKKWQKRKPFIAVTI